MKNIYHFFYFIICFSCLQVTAQNQEKLQLNISNFPYVIKQNSIHNIQITIAGIEKNRTENYLLNVAIDNEVLYVKQLNLKDTKSDKFELSLSHQFNLEVKEHRLKVWLLDEKNEESNKGNEIDVEFLVARTTVPQLPLIEEFTSSTCAPCASFNSTFDPFLASINANESGGQAAAVKYQMNWPSPGDDPSYNAEGLGKRNFYSVNSIPQSFLNGVQTSTFNQSAIDAASGESAFNLVPFFYLSGDTVKATCQATSYTTLSTGLRIYLALTEDFYTYTGGTTSQTTFHYVMRKMLPNYVGTFISNIHEDTTYTTNRFYKVTYGNVAQNNYNIWETSAGFTLVAWIQNVDTKVVYQAAFANTPSAQTINENVEQSAFEVFPNPSIEQFSLKLILPESTKVSYTLSDLNGKLIQQEVVQHLPAGKHVLHTSTSQINPGIYMCTVKAGEQIYTQRIVITK